ncbi:MBOAT family O-acyltransferase [Mesorhizobium sp. SB112]|uniref:MBOAT family O-acyltransferase n=1 Tax=Mesorhizobium sp. SB112 TaxID=3151853 RepID=UPI0032643F0C
MAVFSEPAFIAMVVAAYIFGQLRTRLSRTTFFGVLNSVALILLFGWKAFGILAFICIIYWCALRAAQLVPPENVTARRALPFVLFGGIAAFFVLHKMVLEPGNDFANLFPFHFFSDLSGLWPVLPGLQILQLLALSYVCLRLVDMTRAVLAGERLTNPLGMSAYLAPFFMSPSGPINDYEEHLSMDDGPAPEPTAAHFVDSVFTIVLGYFLKFVIAQSYSIFFIGLHGSWPTATFIDTLVFLTYVLIEFAGYSLITLGIGRLLGVPTPINFNHPYLSTSFTEFWTRWHMSLGAFVRRNIYFPVRIGLTRAMKPTRDQKAKIHLINFVALLLPFAFVGVWHRFTWEFLYWGLAVGIVVGIETIIRDQFRPHTRIKAPSWLTKPLAMVYTISLVVLTLRIALVDFAG